MLFKTVAKYTQLTWQIFRLNLKTAISFKFNFYSQVFGMILNNAAFFSIYQIYFSRFQDINGWTLNDAMILNSLIAITYGITFFLFFGIIDISAKISKSILDSNFTIPKNFLWQVAVSKSEISGLGDIIYGFVLAGIAMGPNLQMWLNFFIMIFFATLILIGFIILTQSYFFFRPRNLDQTEDFLFHIFLTYCLLPQTIFEKVKPIFMFIFPVFFMAFLPTKFISAATIQNFAIISIFSILYFSLSIIVFYLGLRRYESGNSFSLKT